MYLQGVQPQWSELQKKRSELQDMGYGIFARLIIRQQYPLSLFYDFTIFYLR